MLEMGILSFQKCLTFPGISLLANVWKLRLWQDSRSLSCPLASCLYKLGLFAHLPSRIHPSPRERGKRHAAKLTERLCKDGWGWCSFAAIIRIISLSRRQCRPNSLSTGDPGLVLFKSITEVLARTGSQNFVRLNSKTFKFQAFKFLETESFVLI